MASPVDIVLAVRANVQQALTGIGRVRQAAKETQAEVSKVDKALDTVARKGNMIRGRARSGFGAAAGTLAAGGSITEALAAGLGGALPQVATALVGGKFAGNLIDRLQGEDAKIAAAQGILAAPTSVAEAAAALQSLAKNKAGKFSFGRFLRQGGDILTKGDSIISPGQEDRRRELRKAFKDMARSNLPLAIAVAAQLGNPADLVKIISEVQGEQARALQSQQFLAGLPAAPSITNVYSAFDGLGGRNSTGRQVRSVLDARDRNNGRATPTSRR